ncbi:MAG TPA: ABC transporter substrate-binding protein [Stellaceae bacterium]|nr:ABC transporter substrate-binding protein [Stellaceae bacterium]
MTIDTIWYTRCPVPTAFSVAVRLGWLDEEFGRDGIAFRSLASSDDRTVRQSHFDHTQANSIRHGGAIPPLVTRSRGRELKIVALSRSWVRQVVLALPGSGISDARGLAGKRVAIPCRANDSIDFWRASVLRGFELVLKTAGLTLDDVVQVDLPIGRTFVDDTSQASGGSASLWDARSAFGFHRDTIAALVRGEVDAIYVGGGGGVLAQSFLGARIVATVPHTDDPSGWVNNQPYPLTVSGSLAGERSDLTVRLVARLRQAAEWARENERETKRIIAAETGLPEELVDVAYGPKVHEELGIDLSPANIAALRTIHDHLHDHGFLSKPVDLDEFIDGRPLARSADFAGRPAAKLVAAE